MREKVPGKALILFLLWLLLLLFPSASAEVGSEKPHTTTVMIYMCGSDLESRFSSATRDLTEMIASGFDTEATHVLVMAGGSRQWRSGFDAKRTSVAEVTPKGLRTVWRSEEAMNMAEPSTLTLFLDYVLENYPAERNALILWDHGGGPNGGACYDELFNGTSLSLYDLRMALSDSRGIEKSGKLNWIGFDACLMATVETAYMLENYADYLLASQAEEPSSGWNYAFLKNLEEDIDAVATADRIIEAFFENTSPDDELTLSCTDLSKVPQLTAALDNHFSAMYPILTDETYSAFSRERHQTKSFGRAEYNSTADFDLVDLLELAEGRGEKTSSAERLIAAINEAVVLSKSYSPSAHGLSVYHPCFNSSRYTDEWAESYEEAFSYMSKGYTQYVRRFGRILTGSKLGDWSGLETVRSIDDDGSIRFSVALSEEQAEHFEHATLTIFNRLDLNRERTAHLEKIWETPFIELDENHTLSAVFPAKAVYVVDDDTGEKLAGPVDFTVTQEGKLQIQVLYYDEKGIFDENSLNTLYFCSFPEDSDRLQVDRICAFDDLTQEYTLRTEVGEDLILKSDYVNANFFLSVLTPITRGDELPGYQDWKNTSDIAWSSIDLPRSWHFEVTDSGDEQETLYATFQISDTQNGTHSSTLAMVFPEKLQHYSAVIGNEKELSSEGIEIRTAVSYYPEGGMIYLEADLDNTSQLIQGYESKNVTLNGNVRLDSGYAWVGFSWGEEPHTITITPEQLRGIEEISEMDLDLEMLNADYSSYGDVHVKLLFPVPVPVGKAVSLASFEEDGLIWNIRGVEHEWDGSVRITYDVKNTRDTAVKLDVHEIVAGNYGNENFGSTFLIESGMTQMDEYVIYDEKAVYDSAFVPHAVLQDPLAALGNEELSSFRVYYTVSDTEKTEAWDYFSLYNLAEEKEAELSLEEPVPYHSMRPVKNGLERELFNADGLHILLDQLVMYFDAKEDTDVLTLGMWLQNNTDEIQRFTVHDLFLNGSRTENLSFTYDYYRDECLLRPQTAEYFYLQLEITERPSALSTAGFSFSLSDATPSYVEILLTDVKEEET